MLAFSDSPLPRLRLDGMENSSKGKWKREVHQIRIKFEPEVISSPNDKHPNPGLSLEGREIVPFFSSYKPLHTSIYQYQCTILNSQHPSTSQETLPTNLWNRRPKYKEICHRPSFNAGLSWAGTFHQEVVTFSIKNCELTNKRNWLNQQNLVQCWTTQNRGFINKTLGKSTMLSFQNGNVIGQIGYGSSWLVFATQSLVRCAAYCLICMICLMPPRS